MFGANYQYVEPPIKAINGLYDVELTEVKEMNLKGYAVLRFCFKYADGKNRVPNFFDLFDCTNPQDEFAMRQFNIKATRIALCFGLHGNFCQESYEQWRGAKGRVFLSRSENGFINVTDWVDKRELNSQSAQ